MRALATWLLRWLVAGIAATWRVEVVGSEHLRRIRMGGGFAFALWHRSLVPLLWWHRGQDITLLVSAHADGQLLAGAARRWGYRTVRGSSTRGGVGGLRGLIRALEGGATVAVTPDGPRGPAGVVKPGVLGAACRAGAGILPVAAHASRAWEIGSWDRLLIPKPFARVRIVYGAPVRPAHPRRDIATLAERLNAVTGNGGVAA